MASCEILFSFFYLYDSAFSVIYEYLLRLHKTLINVVLCNTSLSDYLVHALIRSFVEEWYEKNSNNNKLMLFFEILRTILFLWSGWGECVGVWYVLLHSSVKFHIHCCIYLMYVMFWKPNILLNIEIRILYAYLRVNTL